MTINEVFSNPTVVGVIFQIKFPSLFFIETKIGELQSQLMKEFPESRLLIRRQTVMVEHTDKEKIELDLKDAADSFVSKIWEFSSPKGYKLNISNNALDLISEPHLTYKNEEAEHRFRDIIKLVVDNFLNLTNLPVIKRIGLRYIDKCPIASRNNITFKRWYNTTLPLNRFSLKDADKTN